MDRGNVMTVKELAKYLKCHHSTVYRLLQKGELPAFKVGADWRFNQDSIDKWRHAREIHKLGRSR